MRHFILLPLLFIVACGPLPKDLCSVACTETRAACEDPAGLCNAAEDSCHAKCANRGIVMD